MPWAAISPTRRSMCSWSMPLARRPKLSSNRSRNPTWQRKFPSSCSPKPHPSPSAADYSYSNLAAPSSSSWTRKLGNSRSYNFFRSQYVRLSLPHQHGDENTTHLRTYSFEPSPGESSLEKHDSVLPRPKYQMFGAPGPLKDLGAPLIYQMHFWIRDEWFPSLLCCLLSQRWAKAARTKAPTTVCSVVWAVRSSGR